MNNPGLIAAETLEKRAMELMQERSKVRRRLLEDAAKDLQIERDIAGCIAGVHALGFDPDIEQPTVPTNKAASMQAFLQARNGIAATFNALKTEFGISDAVDDLEIDQDLRPEMPRIADIVLEQLKMAEESGAKAAGIRRYILDTYNADIHEKTVGMTLYRLSQENPPLVHRVGHVWFFGPAPSDKENPGAETPGPIKSN